jgi:hypothetical protein
MNENLPSDIQPKKKSHLVNTVLFAVLLALLGWSGMQYQALNAPSATPPTSVSKQIAILEEKNRILEQRIVTLEQKYGSAEKVDANTFAANDTSEWAERIGILESRINELNNHISNPTAPISPPTGQSPPPPPPHEAVSVLESRIAALESVQMADEKLRPRMVATLNTFYQLQSMVLLGKPYADEYTQFSEMIGDAQGLNESLDILNSYSDEGVPTLPELTKEFSELVRIALKPSLPENSTFSERLKSNLSSLVVIRKVGEHQKGLSLEAILARAEAHLDKGELEAAVAEVESMTVSEQGQFTDWLSDARTRLSIPATLSDIQQALLQSFSHRE